MPSLRKARYSILLWPSLYPKGIFLLVPLLAITLAGAAILLQWVSHQATRTQIERAEERTRSIVTSKLSGAQPWQWRSNLACEGVNKNCLKAQLFFRDPGVTTALKITAKAEPACAICHATEFKSGGNFFVVFSDIAAHEPQLISAVAIIIFSATLGFLFSLLIFLAMLKRRRNGIVVVALDVRAVEGVVDSQFMARIANDRKLAYYAERSENRLRFAAAAEEFLPWMQKNMVVLEKNRTTMRLVAMQLDLGKNSTLPIEALRGIFRFLAQTPPGYYLIHEDLYPLQKRNSINMRRLVFKNKSGASLKFVAW